MTPAAKGAYLLALQRLGSQRAAAASIGVHETTIINHRKKDPAFAEACEKAKGRLAEELVGTARKLAIQGVEEPIFDRSGNQIGTKRKYDARVLLRWLARLLPEEWSDTVKVDTTVTGTVEHEHKGTLRVEDLTPRQQRLMRELLGDEPAQRN